MRRKKNFYGSRPSLPPPSCDLLFYIAVINMQFLINFFTKDTKKTKNSFEMHSLYPKALNALFCLHYECAEISVFTVFRVFKYSHNECTEISVFTVFRVFKYSHHSQYSTLFSFFSTNSWENSGGGREWVGWGIPS